jgi:hypothetical protein
MSKNIAPPPGFKINGQDVSKILRSFTILPAVSPLVISHYPVLTKYHASLAERGGYEGIVTNGGESLHRVMIHVTGVSLAVSDVLQSILLDGQRRNLIWDLQLKGEGYQAVEAFKEHNQGGKAKDPDKIDFEDGHSEKAPRYGQKYLVSFQNQRSAQHFAREWHRRPLPLPEDIPKSGPLRIFNFSKTVKSVIMSGRAGETMVYTELLW